MTRNTKMQAGNPNQGDSQKQDKQQGNTNAPNKNTPNKTQDPNQIKDPNREAQKGNDKNYPGHATGQSGNDANRNQSGHPGSDGQGSGKQR